VPIKLEVAYRLSETEGWRTDATRRKGRSTENTRLSVCPIPGAMWKFNKCQ